MTNAQIEAAANAICIARFKCSLTGSTNPSVRAHCENLAVLALTAALSGSPQVEAGTWQDDPSADERWNAGCDFAMLQLCSVVGADPKKVIWDSATETLDGDVQSTIGKIIEAGLGENWQDRPREQEGGEAPVAEPVAWDLGDTYGDAFRFTTRERYAASQLAEGLQAEPLYPHPAPLPADGWKEGAEAMREAALDAAACVNNCGDPAYIRGVEDALAAIRSLPTRQHGGRGR